MPLKFGGNLFPKPGLFDDIGLIKQRWQQEGSEQIDIASGAKAVDTTAYTVSTGKVLYINYMLIEQLGTSSSWIIRDGTSGETKFFMNALGRESITLPTPLKFTDSVVMDEVTNGATLEIQFTGWEEPI